MASRKCSIHCVGKLDITKKTGGICQNPAELEGNNIGLCDNLLHRTQILKYLPQSDLTAYQQRLAANVATYNASIDTVVKRTIKKSMNTLRAKFQSAQYDAYTDVYEKELKRQTNALEASYMDWYIAQFHHINNRLTPVRITVPNEASMFDVVNTTNLVDETSEEYITAMMADLCKCVCCHLL